MRTMVEWGLQQELSTLLTIGVVWSVLFFGIGYLVERREQR